MNVVIDKEVSQEKLSKGYLEDCKIIQECEGTAFESRVRQAERLVQFESRAETIAKGGLASACAIEFGWDKSTTSKRFKIGRFVQAVTPELVFEYNLNDVEILYHCSREWDAGACSGVEALEKYAGLTRDDLKKTKAETSPDPVALALKHHAILEAAKRFTARAKTMTGLNELESLERLFAVAEEMQDGTLKIALENI